MAKVKFIISPIGAFNLAYAAGMEAELSDAQAEILIEAGYAQSLETPNQIEKETPEKVVAETPEKALGETPEKKKKGK